MGKEQAIGFFDSGLGGLSVMAAAMKQLPHERFVYLGDSGNAPYGTKSDAEVLCLTQAAVNRLVDAGIKALVVACNTATGAAVEALRTAYDFPIIGLEPALKPAAQAWSGGTILVMATPLTLETQKFNTLFERFGQHAQKLPCPGLMDFVEDEAFDSPALDDYLDALFAPFRGQHIASVVLGCTHYLFLQRQIAAHLPPGTPLFDSNQGVTRQLQKRLSESGLLSDASMRPEVKLISTGGAEKEAQMARMLKLAQDLF